MSPKKRINNFKESWNYIKSVRNYIYFAIILFIAFLLVAILCPTPAALVELINKTLSEIVKKTENLSGISLIVYIFFNNLLAGVIGIVAGIFFCIVPFFIAVSNGYVLGYIIKKMIEKIGLSEGITSLWRLLPHGIFELPAIMISLGIGLRLGVCFFQALNLRSSKGLFREISLAFKTIFYIIIPLLFIAAIIEGLLITFMK